MKNKKEVMKKTWSSVWLSKQDSLANAKVSTRQPCTSRTDFDKK